MANIYWCSFLSESSLMDWLKINWQKFRDLGFVNTSKYFNEKDTFRYSYSHHSDFYNKRCFQIEITVLNTVINLFKHQKWGLNKNSKTTVIYNICCSNLYQKKSEYFAGNYSDNFLWIFTYKFWKFLKIERQSFFETIKLQRQILKLKSILHPFNNLFNMFNKQRHSAMPHSAFG